MQYALWARVEEGCEAGPDDGKNPSSGKGGHGEKRGKMEQKSERKGEEMKGSPRREEEARQLAQRGGGLKGVCRGKTTSGVNVDIGREISSGNAGPGRGAAFWWRLLYKGENRSPLESQRSCVDV